jgi:hypothetical protein
LIHQALERFVAGNMAAVEEDFVPEARIEEVQDGMFGSADVEVHRHPGFFLRRIDERGAVLRVDEAQIVPA